MAWLLAPLKYIGQLILAFAYERVVAFVKSYLQERAEKKKQEAEKTKKVEEFTKEYDEAVKSGDEEKQKDAYKKLFGP